MFELLEPPDTAEPGALLTELQAAARAEARAAARRLTAIWQLHRIRLRERGDHAEWAVDTWAEVAAEVAATLSITPGLAGSYVRFARAMHERLPLVGMVFAAGDIDYRLFQTIVYRTDLITDPDTLAAVDGRLARRAPRWTTLSQGSARREVDRIVARADADAVRRRKERAEDREVVIAGGADGLISIYGSLFATDGHALDQRLSALAATVCDKDPRTVAQRRADALGALAAGADRLGCRCGTADCAAGGKPVAAPVVLHVIAERATADGEGDAPGYLIGAEELIPAELVTELAESAKRRLVFDPVAGPPESGYVPSARLAEFVRCRDLTCRAPGCDRAAMQCDLDHTIPFRDGGQTHASNLKCLCRQHHLLKTFGGWRDQQLPDGTVIWTLPDGQTYVTTPGSALLFPSLCVPTGPAGAAETSTTDRRGERTAMMPKRRRTRAQYRSQRVATERRRNRQAREAHRRARETYHAELLVPPDGDDEPPPF